MGSVFMRSSLIRALGNFSAAIMVGVLSMQAAYAGPEGGKVVRGDGNIVRPNATTTNINQNSQLLVVNWDTFNVAGNETVNFNQPGSDAAALNRIFDQNPSEIFGTINANGRVLLSNPNGLLFGQSASVNVGALIASGLDIDPDSFMAGDWSFASADGAPGGIVVNHGLLQAAEGGSVSLFGGGVLNAGTIIADFGTINLAAGEQVTIDFDGDGLIQFAVDGELVENAHGLGAAVANEGTLRAESGRILMSASSANDVFAQVVNNSGVVAANGVVNDGGRIFLTGSGGDVVNTGNITATSQAGKGGEVRILGDRVGLFGDSRIDVSGATGGGEVRLGGDFQGGDLYRAEQTVIGADATIVADATGDGDGGTVIVWADGLTRFFGDISARGAGSGAGGFVEVSGLVGLQFEGHVDTSAESGLFGTLLLDPTNIEVVASGGETSDLTTVDEFSDPDAGGDGLTTLNVSAINNAASNVVLQASDSIVFNATVSMVNDGIGLTATTSTGDITVNNSITTASTTNASTGGITLNAGGSIHLNASLATGDDAAGQGTTTGSIDLDAGSNINIADGVSVTTGENIASTSGNQSATSGGITLDAGGAIVQADAGGGGVIASGNADANGNATGTSGDITIGATTSPTSVSLDSILQTGTADSNSGNATSGAITVTTSGSLSGSGRIITGGVTAGAGGGDTGTAGTITLNVDGAVAMSGADALTSGIVSVGTVRNEGDLVIAGADSVDDGLGGALDVSINGGVSITTDTGGSGDIAIVSDSALGIDLLETDAASTQTVSVEVSGGALLTMGSAIDIDTDALTLASDEMTISAGITAGDITVTTSSGAQTIDLGSTGTTANSVLELSDAEIGQLTANIVRVGDSTAGAISITDAISATGTSTLQLASGSDITDDGGSITETSLVISSGGSVIIDDNTSDVDNLAGAITGTGSFTFTDTDDITLNTVDGVVGVTTDTGALNLTAGTTIDDADDLNDYLATGGTATLASSGAIGGGATALSTNAATLVVSGTNNNAVTIVDSGAGGATGFDITSGSGAISLTQTTGDLDIVGISTSNNLTATADAGAITQSGGMTVSGTATFTTSTADQTITLTNAANAVSGTLAFNTTGTTGDVAFNNGTTAVDLGASTVNGSLSVTTDNTVTDSAASTVTGTATFAAGAGNDITLDGTGTGTDFNSLAITSGNNVTVVDSNDITLGAATIAGAYSVTANSVDIAGAVSAGSVSFDASGGAGDITDSTGSLSVTGATTLTAQATDSIILDAANDFDADGSGDAVSVTGTIAALTLTDVDDIVLGSADVTGDLAVTASGGISDTGALTVGGTATFDAGGLAAGVNDVTLDTATNDFATVVFTQAGDATIVDDNSVNLGAATVGGLYSVTADAIVVTDVVSAGSVNFDASGAVGDITDTTGSLSVTGAATLAAQATDDIVLDAAANDFDDDDSGDAVAVTSANNVTLVDVDAITLGASTVSGNLDVTGGSIAQSGALDVSGTADFSATTVDGDITLATAGNDIDGTVTFATTGTAGNVSFDNDDGDAGGTTIGTSTVNGSFTADAAGALSVTGTIDTTGAGVDGTVSLTGASVELAEQAVNAGAYSVDVTASAGDITDATPLADTNENIITTGAVSLSATGSIGAGADPADVDISASTDLALNAGTDVYVSNGVELSSFATTLTPSGGTFSLTGATTVTLTDTGTAIRIDDVSNTTIPLDFSLTTTSGDIVIVDGAITNVGSGAVSIAAQSGNIVDSTPGDDSGGAGITIVDGSVMLSASGTIGTAGTGDITIDVTGGTLGTENVIELASGGDINVSFTGGGIARIDGITTTAVNEQITLDTSAGTAMVMQGLGAGYVDVDSDDLVINAGSGFLTFSNTDLTVESLNVSGLSGTLSLANTVTATGFDAGLTNGIDISTTGAINGAGTFVTADAVTAADITISAGSIGSSGNEVNILLGTGTDAGELYLATTGTAGVGAAHIDGSGQALGIGSLSVAAANEVSLINTGADIEFVSPVSDSNIALSAATTTSGDVIFTSDVTVESIDVNAAGNIAVDANLETVSGAANAGDISLVSGGTIAGAGIVTSGSGTTTSGDITLSGTSIGTSLQPLAIALGGTGTAGRVDITTTGADAYLSSASALQVGALDAGGNTVTFNLATTGASPVEFVAGAADVTANNTGLTLDINTAAAGGDVIFNRGLTVGAVDVNSADAIVVDGALATAANPSGTTGDIALVAASAISGTGSLATGNASTTSGSISLSGASVGAALDYLDVNIGSGGTVGDLSLESTGGDVHVVSSSPLNVADLTAAGAATFALANTGLDAIVFVSGATDTGTGSIALDIETTGGAGGTVTFDRAMTIGSLNVIATDDVTVNGAITANDAGPGNAIAITTTGAGSLTGTGSLATADQAVAGTVAADVAESGGIAVNVVDEIEGVDFTVGAATVVGADATDTASVGDITLAGSTIGGLGAISVEFGAADTGGAGIDQAGVLNLDADAAAGGADIGITTTSDLALGTVSTGTGIDDVNIVNSTSAGRIDMTAAIDAGVDTDLDGDNISFAFASSLTPTADSTFDNNGFTLDVGVGTLSLTADTINLSGTVGATGGITVAPADTGSTIGLGTGTGVFQLNDATLDILVAAAGGFLSVGNATAGAVLVDDVTFGAGQTLGIVTGSTIDDTDDIGFAFSGGTLQLDAGAAIGSLNGAQGLDIDVNDLQFQSTGAVTITESTGLMGAGVTLNGSNSADSLDLAFAGALADTVTSDMTVTNNASFSGGSLSLNNGTNAFGSLTYATTGSAVITQSGLMTLAGSSSSGTFSVLEADGFTDGASATLGVGSLLALTDTEVSGNGILLDNGHALTTLQVVSAGDANIADTGGVTLAGTSSMDNLVLTSTGAIANAGGATVTVSDGSGTGNANFSGTAIDLGVTNAGTFNFDTLTFDATTTGNVSIAENSATVLTGTNQAGSLALTSAGTITDAAGTSIDVTNNASFTADNAGTAQNITLGDDAGDTTDFGSLTFDGAIVSITEDSDTQLAGASAATGLTLASSGAISNAATASLGVANAGTGNANFSGTAIDLGVTNAGTFNFDTLTFDATTTGNVSIAENSATVLAGTNQAGSLALTSTGTITDAAGTSIDVTNNASFTADNAGTAQNIILGDDAGDTTDFGSLTFDGAIVSITEDSDTQLAGASAATGLTLASSGAISNVATASLGVANAGTGNANFSGTAIDLGVTNAGTFDFDTLTFDATTTGNVSIAENSATVLAGTNQAGSLALTSTGTITDAAGTSIDVTNNASFTADNAGTAQNITLGDDAGDTTDFGSLTFDGAIVSITEDSATVLSDTSSADSLELASGGSITDDGTVNLTVSGNADFADSAGAGITLDDTYSFGSVTFNSTGAVSITESDAGGTSIAGANTAGSLVIVSGGPIATAAGATLAVDANADFTADNAGTAQDITLGAIGGPWVTLGSVTFDGAQVVIYEQDDVTFSGTSSASRLGVISFEGSINDDGTADVTVTGDAGFLADQNDIGVGTITLDDAYAFGTLGFAAEGDVTIHETDDIVLADDWTSEPLSAANLALVSGGSITDAETAGGSNGTEFAISANASFSADAGAGVITLGDAVDDTTHFGSVTFTGNNVMITEDSATNLLGTSTAGSLALNSGGALTDDANASTTVTGLADLSGTSITLGDAGTDVFDAGTLTFNSAGTVAISQDSAMEVANANTAAGLSLESTDAIVGTGSIVDTGATSLAAGAASDITLDNVLNDFASISISQGNNATVSDTGGVDIGATTIAGNLDVSSTGNVTTSGNITADGGVSLVATGAGSSISMTDGDVIDTTGGLNGVTLSADTNVALSRVLSGGNVSVTATNGVITDNFTGEGAGSENVTGSIVSFNAATGIGTFQANGGHDGDIDIDAVELTAVLSGNGNIGIHESDDIYLNTVDAGLTTGNSVILEALGNINDHVDDEATIDADVTADIGEIIAGGNIGGAPQGGGVNTSVELNVSNLTLDIAGTVDVLDVGFGEVTLNFTGDTDFNYTSINRDILIGLIDVSGLDINDVTITTDNGWIHDASTDTNRDVIATGVVTLSAGDGIGDTGQALTLDAQTLDLQTTTGAIVASSQPGTAATVTVTNLVSGDSTISFDQDGTQDLVVMNVDAGGAVSLDNTGGALTTGTIDTSAGGVSLLADSIVVNDAVNSAGAFVANSTGLVDINAGVTAGSIDLDAGTTLDVNDVLTTDTGTVTLDSAGLTTLAAGGVIDANGNVTFGATGAGALALGGAITTSNDQVVFNNAVNLLAGSLVDSNGGNVQFASTLNGGHSLTVDAAGGNVAFDNAIGGSTALTSLDVTGNAITFGGNVTTSGPITLDNTGLLTTAVGSAINAGTTFNQAGTGNVSLGSDITTNGLIDFNGAVTLTDNISLDTVIASTARFRSNITGGGNALSVDAGGSAGTARFDGASSGIGALTVAATTASDINADIDAASINLTGTTNLAGDVDLLSSGVLTVAGNMTLSGGGTSLVRGQGDANVSLGAVAATGGQSLTVRSEGNLTLTNVNLNGGSLVAQADSDGDNNFSTLAATSLSASSVAVSGGGDNNERFDIASITSTGGDVSLGTSAHLLSTLNIDSAGDVVLSGNLTGSGGSGLVADNAGNFIIGGNITLSNAVLRLDGPATFSGDRTLSNGSGAMSLADISGSGTLTTSSSGTFRLAGDMDVGAFDSSGMSGRMDVAGNASITTANSAIDLRAFSSIQATGTGGGLELDSGSANVTVGNVGTSTGLDHFTASGAVINTRNVVTDGAQTYNGNFNANGNYTAGGAVTVNGTVNLARNVRITGSDIDISGAVDGANELTLNAAGGSVVLGDDVGSTDRLAALNIEAASARINAVTTSGTQSYDANTNVRGDLSGQRVIFERNATFPTNVIIESDTIAFRGATGSVNGSGELTLIPATDGANVDLGGTSGTLNLNADALQGYGGGLVIGGIFVDENTITTRADRVSISGDFSVGNDGYLTVIARSGVELGAGTIEGDTLTMIAASQNGTIRNVATPAGDHQLRANTVILVAGGQIGETDGHDINVRSLSGAGVIEVASGASDAIVNNIGNSMLEPPVPVRAKAIADALNLSTTDVNLTSSAQNSANREQSSGLADEGFIDPSLFEDIALYEVSSTGIALPRDQSEEEFFDEGPSTDCNTDEEDCRLEGAGAVGAISPL